MVFTYHSYMLIVNTIENVPRSGGMRRVDVIHKGKKFQRRDTRDLDDRIRWMREDGTKIEPVTAYMDGVLEEQYQESCLDLSIIDPEWIINPAQDVSPEGHPGTRFLRRLNVGTLSLHFEAYAVREVRTEDEIRYEAELGDSADNTMSDLQALVGGAQLETLRYKGKTWLFWATPYET
jgi:hypothetical protein